MIAITCFISFEFYSSKVLVIATKAQVQSRQVDILHRQPDELKEMELNQLITRTVSDTLPAIVEYSATDYCYSFADIILEMIKWGRIIKSVLKAANFRG